MCVCALVMMTTRTTNNKNSDIHEFILGSALCIRALCFNFRRMFVCFFFLLFASANIIDRSVPNYRMFRLLFHPIFTLSYILLFIVTTDFFFSPFLWILPCSYCTISWHTTFSICLEIAHIQLVEIAKVRTNFLFFHSNQICLCITLIKFKINPRYVNEIIG